jgi:hypothetical protein
MMVLYCALHFYQLSLVVVVPKKRSSKTLCYQHTRASTTDFMIRNDRDENPRITRVTSQPKVLTESSV